MPVGKKKSPAKFIGALSLGLGVIKGATSIIGGNNRGRAERDLLKEENALAGEQYDAMRKDIRGLSITNPYKDLNTSFENTFEDMTVNQQQAQFQAQQAAQARANLLSNLQGAAGSSGIAGLAQALANQQQVQGQQISASIGQQEAANQRASAQGAMRVQAMEQQARQTVMGGEFLRQQSENERQMNLLNLQAGRQDAERDFRAQMLTSEQNQKQAVMGGVGDLLGAGLKGFAYGGGFSEGGFKMDTFLGRESGIGFDAAGDGVIGVNESFASNDFNTQHLSPNYDPVTNIEPTLLGGVSGPNTRQNYINRRKKELQNSTKVSYGPVTQLGNPYGVVSSFSPNITLEEQQRQIYEQEQREIQNRINQGLIR